MKEEEKAQVKSQADWEGIPCARMAKQDALDRVVLAAAFIWAGMVVFFAHSQDYPEDQAWSLFFLGAWTLVLSGIVVRLVLPGYRNPVLVDLIWAALLFGAGTDRWDWVLPIILIVIGWSLLRSVRLRI
jgi:hypothetical protein